MTWLTGSAAQLCLTAVFGLRLGERRTLARWTVTDAAAAVAVGAIIGRTAVADTESYLTGATALVTIIASHRVISLARFHPRIAPLVGHRVRILVADRLLRRRQLRLCGLTDDDLYVELRLHGVFDVAAVRYVLFEPSGGLTIVPTGPHPRGELVERGLRAAVDYRSASGAPGPPAR